MDTKESVNIENGIIKTFLLNFITDTKDSANAVTDSSSSKSESINGGITDRRPVSSLSLRSISSKYKLIYNKSVIIHIRVFF